MQAQTVIASGDCGASGNNLTWVLTDDSVLTINGSGAMADYTYDNGSPWTSNRNKVKTLVIGNSITTIGDLAFYDCSELSGALTIPNLVTTIGNRAFSGCIKLSGTLTIPNLVTTIGDGAFAWCSELSGTLTIPSSVTTIGEYAFHGCSGLSGTLTIPNLVTTIGECAFHSCSGLSGALIIPNLVTFIGDGAFTYCSGLTGSLTIPNLVTTIGHFAFAHCSLSGTLTIGNSVTTIGNEAFFSCSGLTEITSLAINPPAILGALTFENVSKTIPVHVPCESENAYQAADGWREFTNYTDCIGGNALTDVEATSFNIYPNPANDRINFSCSEAIKEIEVFNIVGQQVYSAKVNEKFTALNVAGFAKGSYIAKLHTVKGVVTKKFVVE